MGLRPISTELKTGELSKVAWAGATPPNKQNADTSKPRQVVLIKRLAECLARRWAGRLARYRRLVNRLIERDFRKFMKKQRGVPGLILPHYGSMAWFCSVMRRVYGGVFSGRLWRGVWQWRYGKGSMAMSNAGLDNGNLPSSCTMIADCLSTFQLSP